MAWLRAVVRWFLDFKYSDPLILRRLSLVFPLVFGLGHKLTFALPEDCSLESVSCVGPIIGPYRYTNGIGTEDWKPGDGFSTEQLAIDAWEPYYESTVDNLCSYSGTMLRDWVDISHVGSGITATSDGRSYEWNLNTEVWQHLNSGVGYEKPTRKVITYGIDCQNVWEDNHGIIRSRVVECPEGYRPNYVILPRNRYCVSNNDLIPDKNPVCTRPGTTLSNPVNAAIGNKFAVETDVNDRVLRFERTYNSIELSYRDRETIGVRWRHSFDRAISAPGDPISGTVYAFRSSGKVNYYTLSGDKYISDPDVTDSLVYTGNGWEYTTAANSVESYDSAGRLVSITEDAGITYTADYDELQRLSRVDTNTGEYLIFGYDTSDRISTLTDHTNRI